MKRRTDQNRPTRMQAPKPAWAAALTLFAVVIAVAAGCWMSGQSESNSESNGIGKPLATNDLDPWTPRSTDGYVGSEACVTCHEEISKKYQSHPMYHAASTMADTATSETSGEETRFQPRVGIQYEVQNRDGEFFHVERGVSRSDATLFEDSVRIDYVLGSGAKGRSYLHQREGRFFQSPLSWYSSLGKWDLSPGYQPESHPRFDRQILDRCLHCHAGRMNYGDGPKIGHVAYEKPHFLEFAIGCERCHGPGRDHIDLHNKGSKENDPIINPARLPPTKREAVCTHCHLVGEIQVLRKGRINSDFRPGDHVGDIWSVFVRKDAKSDHAVGHVEQIRISQCFQKSNQQLGCITCHDPHATPAPDELPGYYDAKCANCHTEDDDNFCRETKTARLAEPANGSCIHCHMPKAGAGDVPHTSETDHRILSRPTDASTTPADLETQPFKYLGIFDLEEAELPDLVQKRANGLLLASLAESGQHTHLAPAIEQALRPVCEAAPDDVVALDALAMSLMMQQRVEEAEKIWKDALQLDSHPSAETSALLALTEIAERKGDYRQAEKYCQRLIELEPWEARWRYRLARIIDAMGGRTADALQAGMEGIERNPTEFELYPKIITLLRRAGRFDDADSLTRRIREIPPSREAPASPPEGGNPTAQ